MAGLIKYLTVKGYGVSEMEIDKSRFITYVQRVETETDAFAFIAAIRKQHWDATHCCTAFSVGGYPGRVECQKADDDGEPSGTAGKPILEVIKKSQLHDTIIAVVRYFGGIKLGAGGLIRAYGKGASGGIKAAGIVERVPHEKIAITVDYHFLGKLENELRSGGYIIDEIEYLEQVRVIALIDYEKKSAFEKAINEWTAGQAAISIIGDAFVERLINDQ